ELDASPPTRVDDLVRSRSTKPKPVLVDGRRRPGGAHPERRPHIQPQRGLSGDAHSGPAVPRHPDRRLHGHARLRGVPHSAIDLLAENAALAEPERTPAHHRAERTRGIPKDAPRELVLIPKAQPIAEQHESIRREAIVDVDGPAAESFRDKG